MAYLINNWTVFNFKEFQFVSNVIESILNRRSCIKANVPSHEQTGL